MPKVNGQGQSGVPNLQGQGQYPNGVPIFQGPGQQTNGVSKVNGHGQHHIDTSNLQTQTDRSQLPIDQSNLQGQGQAQDHRDMSNLHGEAQQHHFDTSTTSVQHQVPKNGFTHVREGQVSSNGVTGVPIQGQSHPGFRQVVIPNGLPKTTNGQIRNNGVTGIPGTQDQQTQPGYQHAPIPSQVQNGAPHVQGPSIQYPGAYNQHGGYSNGATTFPQPGSNIQEQSHPQIGTQNGYTGQQTQDRHTTDRSVTYYPSQQNGQQNIPIDSQVLHQNTPVQPQKNVHPSANGHTQVQPTYADPSRTQGQSPTNGNVPSDRCHTVTFTCTIIFESNGRAKLCRPKTQRNDNGHGQQMPATTSAICCC